MPDLSQKRLGQLFGFLDALNQMRNQPTKGIGDQPWSLSFEDLPDHPCVTRANTADFEDAPDSEVEKPGKEEQSEPGGSDFVLKISRPELTDSPLPPDSIKDWLHSGWKEIDGTVSARESRNELSEDGHTIIVRFDADPARPEALTKWTAVREEWIVNERPARAAMALFERLYELHGRIEREGERFELIVGDGILSWRRPEGGILHPILLKRIQLQFDADAPEFTFVETGTPTEIYSALFRSMSDVDGRLLGKCREEVEKRGHHPLGAGLTSGFLRKFAQLLSAQGQYADSFPLRIETDHPRISRNPFIFLRSRSLGFTTAIEAILEDIKDRAEFPSSLLNIVGVESRPLIIDTDGEEDEGFEPESQTGNEDVDILLSKPANAEQLKLAQRLEQHGSVIVQGPPGTGKTHTIANLLGHLLAQGKSVLVTSHTSKALRVLREKVVGSLQPLCVSVLESDLDSRKQLEGSVARIVERLTSSDQKDLERKAVALTNTRQEILTAIEKTRQDLLTARNGEYRDIVIAGQAFTPSAAARLVATREKEDSWIPSPVSVGAPIPLSDTELHELYQTNDAVTAHDETELTFDLPELNDLPHPTQFRQAVDRFHQLSKEDRDHGGQFWKDQATDFYISCPTCQGKNRVRLPLGKPRESLKLNCGKCKAALEFRATGPESVSADPERLEALVELTHSAAKLISPDPNWSTEAIMAGWKGGAHRESWDNLIIEIDDLAKLAGETKELILRYSPDVLPTLALSDLETTLKEINAHFSADGQLSFWILLTKPTWKKLINTCTIEGAKPKDKEHFIALHAYVRLTASRVRVLNRWEKMISSTGGLKRGDLGSAPEVILEQFRAELLRLLNWHSEKWEPLLTELDQIGVIVDQIIESIPPVASPIGPILRIREAATKALPPVLTARASKLRWEEAKKFLDSLRTRLQTAPRKARSELVASLHLSVESLNPDLYSQTFDGLSVLLNKRRLMARRQELLAKLEASAPGWASAIRHRSKPHDARTIPANLKQAWVWRQLHDEIEERNKVSAEELQAQLESLTVSLQEATSDLIDKRAWAAQVERTTHGQRQALTGWVETVRRIGKGTGRRAPRLEIEARKLMGECRSAVPVWIMPLSRVVENFDPRHNHFDVVIVDEASQLDVMGLIALYMADQVVIVGDHEQVSPEAVGQKLDEVQHLIDEHLGEVPNANLYDGKLSVYDLAKTAFGGQLCLKEHFRCVEEIIQFSNHLCYQGQVRPLRDSSTANLKPHVIEHRVEGQCGANNVNHNESLATASLIAAAIKQPEYAGKTFGVISLLGDEQARDIDTLLRRHLAPVIYEERKIVCGNAAHFQGDERDVMFLTVVDSPQQGPLPFRDQPLFRKRFNVAASRARDQMWVVHSLNPERDLQPLDLRRRLIQHAQDPMARVRELEKAAARTDSEFERQVLTRLLDAGYKVIPQWRVGYYRIDLVVEGRSSRLAVECDGDRYHTMDNLREDMARQAVLERLGWKFVRIRGTRFFRDPDGEVTRILSRLEALGIEKLAGTSPDAAQHSNQELTERLNRAAEEIRQLWAADPAYVYEEQPAKQRRPSSLKKGWLKASESRQKQPEPKSPPTAQEDELPLDVEADDSNGRSIDDIPQEAIREALRQLVPKGSRVEREDLLKKLAAALGQQRLGRKIRSRLNRAIGGEARAHNLETDWDFVWRPSDSGS